MGVADQGIPAVQCIAHGGSQIGFAGDLRQCGFEPRLQVRNQRLGILFAASPSLIERLAPDTGLYPIKRADAVEGLFGEGRSVGGMDVEELAPHMGPAGGFGHLAAIEDSVEPGIAIRMQYPLEALQVALGMFALAVGRVEEHGGRRLLAAPWPAIADIGPQSAGPGFAKARSQHGNRRVVAMQHIGTEDLPAQRRHQGIEKSGRPAHPVGECRAFEIDALAGIDARLPVERQVIGIFGDQHMGKQSGTGTPTLDRQRGHRQLHDGFAFAAR